MGEGPGPIGSPRSPDTEPGADDSLSRTRADAAAPAHEAGDDEPHLAPGDRIGRYVVLSSLGKGGMSVVFLAYDPELDRRVALKLMRVTMLGEKGKLRLQREAQALAKLSHPNVVPVYDAGTAFDQAFVAMEFVEGRSLRKWLKEPHDWRRALAVMLDAGKGLAAAHAAGLVHRDFKPDNVVLGEDGRVRVLDFGLARLASMLDGSSPSSHPSLDDPPSEAGVELVPTSAPSLVELTRADQLIGTPAYMAPEQMRREPTDERADQYSYCVTLYEALHGHRPFDVAREVLESAESTAALSTLVERARTPHAAPRASKVPGWLQRVIARGLRDAPGDRWPSMDALLLELSRDPVQKWRRAGVALAVVAGIAASAGLVARAQGRTRAMCHGGEGHVAAVWGPAAKGAVTRAFAATRVPYAATATATITTALDAYAAQWAMADDDACAGTRIRGEQSEEALDLRMACLSDRLKELGALVDVVSHADVETVQQASHATQTLGPIPDCADIAALRAPTPRPRDAATAAKIDELEKRLAIVQAHYAVGKSADAGKLGDALLADATAAGYGPMTSQVQFWRGRAYADLGESDKSIPAFRAAFALALGSRSDRVLRWSSARLAQEYVYASQPDDYAYWVELAEQALARSGPDAELENFVSHMRCVSMWASGRVASRMACLEKHAAKVERARPLNDWELVTLGLAASDAGDATRGLDYLRRGYDYSVRTNGPTHPRSIEMRAYLCKGILDYGDLEGAARECREGLALAAALGDANPYILGRLHLYLGATLRQLHEYVASVAELELAKGHSTQPDEVLGELAMNESAQGRHEAALAYLQASLAAAEKSLPPGHANVVASQIQLAAEELAAGRVKEASALLGRARAGADQGEVSPMMRAALDFEEAQARWSSAPPERGPALELARRARDAYAAHAPATRKYDEERREIEQWIVMVSAAP